MAVSDSSNKNLNNMFMCQALSQALYIFLFIKSKEIAFGFCISQYSIMHFLEWGYRLNYVS